MAVLPALDMGASQASEPPHIAGNPVSMHKSKAIDIARAILVVPKNRSSWEDYIVKAEHYNEFIWSADGDETARWNELASSDSDNVNVKRGVVKGEEVFLSYKGRTLKEPLIGGREDNVIAIHTLNRLVKADFEIRYCVDSTGSSDLVFLALSPKDWNALEKEFGVKAVAYRFMTLPDNLNALWKGLESEERTLQRQYINQ